MNRTIALAALLFLALPALAADDHPIDKKLAKCIDADSSTAGTLNCLNAAYDAWDKELNASYKTLMAKLDPKQKESLKNAQRAWIAYRDGEFALIDSIYEGLQGTMYLPMRTEDRVDVVRQRALALGGYVTLMESGD